MRPQMLPLIAVVLVLLFLVGCGSTAPTPVVEAPAATSEPEQTAATPTTEPPTSTLETPPDTPTPEPPTATPTPLPPTATPTPAIANPQPGATFSGPVEIGEKAASTTISFTVADDGTSITLLELTIVGPFECSDASAAEGAESAQNVEGPLPITEGTFEASLFGGGKVEGQFTSPTEASGTIDMALYYLGRTCDWGTFDWSAQANSSTSSSESSSETGTSTTLQPAPNALFSGPMELSEAGSDGTASGGAITLLISKDGLSIDYADITLTDVKCPSSSSGSVSLPFGNPVPIGEGQIEMTASGLGKQTLTGQFISSTEAEGSVTIIMEIPLEKPCNLGTWNWSAKAK